MLSRWWAEEEEEKIVATRLIATTLDMNLSLQDPLVITADYPSSLTTSLSYGQATTLSVSRCGHYIASGLINGLIIIIDSWTHNISAILRGHSKGVANLKWVYNGQEVGLISRSSSWQVIHWKLQNGKFELFQEYKFVGGVGYCDWFISGNEVWLMVAKVDGQIVLVDPQSRMVDIDLSTTEGANEGTCQCFSIVMNGKYAILGTSKGWIQILDISERKIVKSFKISPSNIKNIDIVIQAHYEGDGSLEYGEELCSLSRMVVNSSDKVLRQYVITNWSTETPIEEWSLDLEHKYQDVVNQVQWNNIKLGTSGEYLCASTKSHGGSSHEIFVWETSMGSLVQILEGSQEELYSVDWCGRKCEIVATGFDTGTLYFWGIQIEPKWSALAPDFEEIEQNIDYIEQEDEFDFLGGETETGDNTDDKSAFENDNNNNKYVDVFKRENKDARGFPIIDNVKVDIDLTLDEL